MQDVVLLGASNLVLSWPTVLSSLRRLTAAPLRVNVAMGMGRSYIKTSAFWFRRLPVDSGMPIMESVAAIRSCTSSGGADYGSGQ